MGDQEVSPDRVLQGPLSDRKVGEEKDAVNQPPPLGPPWGKQFWEHMGGGVGATGESLHNTP